VNEDTEYSTPCNAVNIVANTTVYNRPYSALLLLAFIKKWCPYVTVNTEESKITVLINGSSKVFPLLNLDDYYWLNGRLTYV
jgi:hypothetical protein